MRKELLYLTEFASEIYAKLHACKEVKDAGYHISLGPLVIKKNVQHFLPACQQLDSNMNEINVRQRYDCSILSP